MTIPGPMRPFVLCAVLLATTTLAPAADLPQSRGGRGSEPQPRFAWHGNERPALERSSRQHPMDAWRPGIWDGLYGGINGGFGWGRAEPAYRYDSIELDGGLLGGHVGYNWQRGNLVLGLETDAAWSGADGSRLHGNGDRLDIRNSWLSSLRLRAGVNFGNTLVYATGGMALGGFDSDLATLTSLTRNSDMLLGYVVGGGIEMKITGNISGRIEALHYGFNDKSFEFAAGDLRADLSTTTVRAGLTYHFNN